MKHLLTALALILLLFPLWGCSSTPEEEPLVSIPRSALWSGVSGKLEGLDWDQATVTFASVRLEETLLNRLGIQLLHLDPEKGRGQLRRWDLRVITQLEISHLDNLEDLLYLTNLETLSLSYASPDTRPPVDFVPLGQLTGLRSLKISYAEGLEDLTFLENLAGLEQLSLRGCGLVDLSPLEKLTQLRSLDLYNNDISDISPLAALTALEELNLTWNSIGDISPLSRLTKLRELSLSTNRIADITPLTELTCLQLLELNSNQIADISPLTALPYLHTLKLSHNQITDLSPLAGLAQLNSVTLVNNLVGDFSPLLALEELETADLRDNHIAALPQGINYPQLAAFSLSGNPLDYAPLAEEILLPENLQATSSSGRYRLYTLGEENFLLDSESGRISLAEFGGVFQGELFYVTLPGGGIGYQDPATGELTRLELDRTPTAMEESWRQSSSGIAPRKVHGTAYHQGLNQWVSLSEAPDTRFWVDYYSQTGEHLRSVETPFIQAYYPNFGSYEPEHNEFHLWGDWLVFYDFTIYGQRWPHQEVVAYNVRNNTWWYPQADFIRGAGNRLVLAAYAYDEWENQYIQADLYYSTQLVCSLWAPLGGRGRITEGSRYMTYDYNKNIFTFSGIELNFADALEKHQSKGGTRHAE